ncbi:HlyD family secretion protein/macrolide-specific efflux system membrane fusion protein [Paenibacillus phyllosphaerae]|uniref:HlyD family secretion protein/macrolide-specific efflux system membrane fusion protein n=1 Tax=Paenibacillus phyllosphaerae TaxID=274593 RepID=A0A7W5B412_9BACL|nr:HlyD family secretion protein/macrolide-specific efflux system membrane fusion protein [Paenibacillus phyllosphaerae]
MKRKIKWLIIGLILVAISVGLYSMQKPSRPLEETGQAEAITFEVTQETLVQSIEVKGKSLYEQETPVYAPFSSNVNGWNVEDGQQVKKGDVLFQLDQTALQNEIVQEEATLKKASLEAELQAYMAQLDSEAGTLGASENDRKRTLANKEIARLNQELSEVTAGIQRKTLAQKKEMLGEAQYRSPASGIFLFESAGKRPQAVSDDQYIGKIVDLDKLQFVALVGEQDVFRIKPEMAVQVKMAAMKELSLTGKVQRVSKFAKTGTDQNNIDQAAQFEVIIALAPNENLIAGLTLNGQIETERKEKVTVVPTIAIMRDQDQYYVMLDNGNGQLERRDIKVGMETAEKTEVTEGLKPGDVVVLQ